MHEPQVYRVRDLPAAEQLPFLQSLIRSKTKRPQVPGAKDQDQDGYYWCDYNMWKIQQVEPTKK